MIQHQKSEAAAGHIDTTEMMEMKIPVETEVV